MNDTILEQAYAARQAGDDAQAEALCRQILASNPQHRGARSLLAVCLAEAGDLAQAAPMAVAVLEEEPGNWRFALNLSAIRQLEGDVTAATAWARDAAQLAPQRFEPWGRLGDLLGQQGQFDEAVSVLEHALQLNPAHPGVAMLLAGAALETGDDELCALALAQFEKAVPGHPEALRLRTHLARRSGDLAAYLDFAAKWLAAVPSSEAARAALADAQAQGDDFHRAIETFRPLAQAHQDDAGHQATFARYLLWARDFGAAEQAYARALELQGDKADAAAGLARLKVYQGELEEAERLARQALAADLSNVEAHSQLVLATDGRISDADLSALEQVASDPALPANHHVIANFALGDVYHRRKERTAAFAAWQKGNDTKRGTVNQKPYDPDETEKLVSWLAASFTDLPPRQAPSGNEPTPIFVVGMPRSGTTLLDSALSAHPEISSGGELPAMPAHLRSFRSWAARSGWSGGPIPEQVLQTLRQAYLAEYETYGISPARFVVDKQPPNFMAVGLIRHVFPAAPIIHIRRNALETGFSIYRKNFTRAWPYSMSLEDIGHYYGQYDRMMAHWQAVAPESMATVRYETLVQDFEAEMHRLLEFIGLPWDDRCLSFHEQKNVVTTLSATQVRQGPSSAFINSTEPYSEQLQPLREALTKAGVAPD